VFGTISIGSTGVLRIAGATRITNLGTYLSAGGTVGAPAYSFSSENTTGMYRNAAGVLGFSVLGADVMALKSGNVGIGTTTPSDNLTINGNARIENQGQLKFSELRANGNQMATLSATSSMAADVNWTLPSLTIGTTGNVLTTNSVGNMDWATNLYITPSGNVGIGTTTPSSLFQIFNTATSTASIDSNSASRGGCLEIKDRDGGGYTYITTLDGVMTASQTSCK